MKVVFRSNLLQNNFISTCDVFLKMKQKKMYAVKIYYAGNQNPYEKGCLHNMIKGNNLRSGKL